MDFESRPQYWINHLGFLLRKRLVAGFAEAGEDVTAEEWAVLLILQGVESATTTELSARTMRDKTTITRLIDRMVTKGIVKRQPGRRDRRVQHLVLTDAGRALFARLTPVAGAMIARSEKGIPAEDLATTIATLTRMTRNLTDTES